MATAPSRKTAPRTRFTWAEANALVPKLELLVPEIQKGYADLRAVLVDRPGELDAVTLSRLVAEDPSLRKLVDRLAGRILELEGLGVVFQGPDLGLVDFPSELDGEPVYLCWQYGEKRIEWYHGIQDGFAGRKRLPSLAPSPRYD